MRPTVIASRYRLEQLIGRGTSAEVFRATDLRHQQPVAIKIMVVATDQAAIDDVDLARDVDAARRLNHPGIAAVLDAGRSASGAWLVMPLVAGAPLSRYTQRSRLLPEALVLRLMASLARAVAHAHAQGVVHRDLKPANVMVDLTSGCATVLDFGVARIDDRLATRTGLTLGTPAYMAPELLAGEPASPASDTYALGVMLFEMLTAERPHQAASLGQLLRAIATAPALDLATRRADLPAGVVAVANAMVHAQAARRPQDLQALATQLDQLAAELEPRAAR